MKIKYSIVSQSPFSRRDLERYGYNALKKMGFEVNLIDVSGLTNPRISAKWTPTDMVQANFIIKNLSDFEHVLTDLTARHVFIIFVALNSYSFSFFKALSSANAVTIFNISNIPLLSKLSGRSVHRRSLVQRIQSISKITLRSLHGYLLRKWFYKFYDVKGPTFLICGGTKSDRLGGFYRNSIRIWAHHLDYENALALDLIDLPKELQNQPYAVFLDNATPVHPDNFARYDKMPANNAPEVYYPSVIRSLEELEKLTGVPVVIALHPRCPDDLPTSIYGNRKTFRNSSALLVKHSKFAIAHHSTALSYCVIFKKPVEFIQSSAHSEELVERVSSSFDKKSHPPGKLGQVQIDSIDKDLYDRLMTEFIKTKFSKNISIWEIVTSEIAEYFQKNKDSQMIKKN